VRYASTSAKHDVGQRFNALLLSVPVFVKVMGIALGMVAVLGSGMLWQIHQTWHAHMVQELREEGRKLAQEVGDRCEELSRAGLAADIPVELRQVLAESPNLNYIILQDKAGVVLGEAHATNRVSGASRVHELTCSLGKGARHLRVGMSTRRVDNEVGWLTRRLARTTAIIALLGMLAAWWLTRIFAHPIEELASLTRGVQAGNYGLKAPVRARDEVGALAVAFNQMTEAIAQKEAARQHLHRQVIRAGEEERKRIARELHDQTGQALTSQIATLSALENQCPGEEIARRLAELRHQTEQTLSEVHDLAVTLRPSVLDDVGLIAALQRHCRRVEERFAVQTTCLDIDVEGQRFPAEVELTIYRVVQEALTNGIRHGRPGRLQVLVQRTKTGLLAVVRDNGGGFDAHDWQKRCAEGNHLGLLGMEERVTLVGGSFCVDSEPGKGATVFADIPLKETA
jgi:signal transduction histidine kinase